MDKLFSILGNQKALRSPLRDKKIVANLKKNWELIFGKLAKDLHFSMYRKCALTIGSSNYLWVNEINYFKKEILEKITRYVGKNSVKYIKVVYDPSVKAGQKEICEKELENKLSFEEKIQHENKKKRDDGQTLCDRCSAMYSAKKYCVYCE
jgi:hypothetical protein